MNFFLNYYLNHSEPSHIYFYSLLLNTTRLQSLVERYGCIAGYPDGNFKGNRAITRFEFATALNACLDKVNQKIAADTTGTVVKEDLATLQKLQKEFTTELTSLRGRVDALEARTKKLEKQECSKTPKLDGQVIVAVVDAFGDASGSGNGDNSNLVRGIGGFGNNMPNPKTIVLQIF